MIQTNPATNQTPYTNKENLFKSEWSTSCWNRKQVRILIEETGRLSVQTVTQSTFHHVISQGLKFFSCGHVKSFGKYVASQTSDFALPHEVELLLTEKQTQDVQKIRSEKYLIAFLPKYQSLNDLGASLCDYALDRQCGESGRRKVLDMHEEILSFQLKINEAVQNDLPSAEFLKTFQEIEAQIDLMCKTYPKELKDFIDKEEQLNDDLTGSLSVKNKED